MMIQIQYKGQPMMVLIFLTAESKTPGMSSVRSIENKCNFGEKLYAQQPGYTPEVWHNRPVTFFPAKGKAGVTDSRSFIYKLPHDAF